METGRAHDLVIGVVPDPEQSEHWSDFKGFLEPARVRGGLPTLIGFNELVWGVLEAGKPIAAATARLCDDDVVEVVLVGGKEYEKWIEQLDQAIGACAAEAGATHLRAFGRRGWTKRLRALGWAVTGERDGFRAYQRGIE